MTHPWLPAIGRLLAGVMTAAVIAAGGMAPVRAQESGTRAGDAVVIGTGGSPLSAGGSATRFRLELPDGSACPGDSAHSDYRVQTFVVPASDDPSSLVYDSIQPAGEGRYALYQTDTVPAVHLLTAVEEVAGGPGPIVDLPEFDFAVWPPKTLADGDYRWGVACTLGRSVTRYWDVVVTITNTASDEPAQLQWSVAGAAPADSSASVPVVGIVGVAMALLAVGAVSLTVVRSRRLTSADATSQEEM